MTKRERESIEGISKFYENLTFDCNSIEMANETFQSEYTKEQVKEMFTRYANNKKLSTERKEKTLYWLKQAYKSYN